MDFWDQVVEVENHVKYEAMTLELCTYLREAVETLQMIKTVAIAGDGTSTELNCHHLAEDCLERLGIK